MNGPAELRLRTAGVHWRTIEGEVLLLDARTQRYMALNRTGTLLWELLGRGTTRAELAERLVAEYGLDPERAAADVAQLLEDLAERDLLAAPDATE